MKRRTFVKKSFAWSAALSTLPGIIQAIDESKKTLQLPRRKLGQTGEMLSIIGFGGILVRDETPENAANLVASAVNSGVNYFDVAPSYGNAEERLGPALAPYRQQCFLACKTQQRDRAGAEKELHESLTRLQTDHFDLYQLHALSKVEDVEQAFGPDGAMEVFLKAKQAGKVRFLGFSAHSEAAALLAMEKFDFDTILFPINFVCWHQGNFGPKVVAQAQSKKMGILALKALAFTRVPQAEEKPYKKLWYKPIEVAETAQLALRFTLMQGTTAAIPPGDAKFWGTALEIARNYTELATSETEQLKKISTGVAPIFKV